MHAHLGALNWLDQSATGHLGAAMAALGHPNADPALKRTVVQGFIASVSTVRQALDAAQGMLRVGGRARLEDALARADAFALHDTLGHDLASQVRAHVGLTVRPFVECLAFTPGPASHDPAAPQYQPDAYLAHVDLSTLPERASKTRLKASLAHALAQSPTDVALLIAVGNHANAGHLRAQVVAKLENVTLPSHLEARAANLYRPAPARMGNGVFSIPLRSAEPMQLPPSFDPLPGADASAEALHDWLSANFDVFSLGRPTLSGFRLTAEKYDARGATWPKLKRFEAMLRHPAATSAHLDALTGHFAQMRARMPSLELVTRDLRHTGLPPDAVRDTIESWRHGESLFSQLPLESLLGDTRAAAVRATPYIV